MIFSWRLTVLCVSRSFLFSLSTYTPHTNLENCTWRQKFDECCPCVNERWRLCCHLYICRRRQPNQHQPRVRVPFITGNLIAYHAHMWDISYYFIVHHLQWVIDRSSFLILFNVFQVYFRKIHVANINHIAPNLLFLHRWQTVHFSHRNLQCPFWYCQTKSSQYSRMPACTTLAANWTTTYGCILRPSACLLNQMIQSNNTRHM